MQKNSKKNENNENKKEANQLIKNFSNIQSDSENENENVNVNENEQEDNWDNGMSESDSHIEKSNKKDFDFGNSK